VQPTVVSRRSFVGNGAYVPDGTTVPENVLIGVMSAVPRNATMQAGDTWLGAPPLHLPARELVAGFAEHLTFAPSRWRKLARGSVEAFRIAAPHALVIAAGYAIVLDAMPLAEQGRWGAVMLGLAVSGVLFGLATFLFVAVFKWLAVGGATGSAPCPCGRPSSGCPRPPPTCTRAWPCRGSCATCAARPG
jgi:non-ribosomal peptide synthetase-like protein